MHNMCMKPRGDQVDVARAIQLARRHGLTQAVIADAVGASQSQVSRVLSGQTSAHSKLAKDICIYVLGASAPKTQSAVSANEELMAALADVWDGTPAHARALATVIRSLTLLNPSTSAAEGEAHASRKAAPPAR